MTITTGMHPAIARAEADIIKTDDAAGDYALDWLLTIVGREWDEPDRSVGHAGGWVYTARVIGAVIGELVLSREDAAKAFEGGLTWVEKHVSDDLTERADDDLPMMPSRMEDAE
jgi:hypothetical protein